MNLKQFEKVAHRAFEEIPQEYREGVDGLTVRAEALPHPLHPDIYTMGMCLTESYPSDWMGPDTTRSVVVLYHGSFEALAELDPSFDWKEQLWETLTHELRHHLESLANEDGLEGVDYALEESFKRFEGEEFDPLYFQSGDSMGRGIYQVEEDFYLEQVWTEKDFESAALVHFWWHGRRIWATCTSCWWREWTWAPALWSWFSSDGDQG
jgi:predicted Zn-dependent protease with MMP-like domain